VRTEGQRLVDLMRMMRDEWDAGGGGAVGGHDGLRLNVAIAWGNWPGQWLSRPRV
jgi:hypothetical protein